MKVFYISVFYMKLFKIYRGGILKDSYKVFYIVYCTECPIGYMPYKACGVYHIWVVMNNGIRQGIPDGFR